MTLTGFVAAAGSTVGARHRHADRPSQDAFALHRFPGGLAAVVADGCGSRPRSELGAALGARMCCRALELASRRSPSGPELVADALGSLLTRLGRVLGSLPAATEHEVSDAFLFTLLGAVVTESQAVVFALGDGIVALNGEVHLLDQDNAPSYLGYHLLDRTAPAARCWTLETRALESLLLGSDGLGDLGALDELWTEPRYVTRPDALRRRLTLASRDAQHIDWEARRVLRQPARLRDDATCVVVRRSP